MPELDSLRGIAILLVLFFHGIAPIQNPELSYLGKMIFAVSQFGWIGVNLFFVLSGFLITGILMDNRNLQNYYRRFYIRRAVRILPALYMMLLLLLVGGWIDWRFLLLSLICLANIAPLFGVPLQYGSLWSLAVEEHFYLFWPALVRRSSARRLTLITVVIFALAPVSRGLGFAMAYYPHDFTSLYTWSNIDGLALGAFLAILVRQPSFRRAELMGVALALLVAAAAAFMLIWKHPLAEAAFTATAWNLVSAGFLSGMLFVGTSRWNFLVDRPFLKFLGFISYGLYLVHLLAFRLTEILLSHWLSMLVSSGRLTAAMLVRFFAGTVLAILAAYFSRRSLEEKFLQMGRDSKNVRVLSAT